MSYVPRRAKCTSEGCRWRGAWSDVLMALSPFRKDNLVCGCPRCRQLTVVKCCQAEDPPCWEAAQYSQLIPNDVRWVCWGHMVGAKLKAKTDEGTPQTPPSS
jgi:hypothetical protein